MMLQNERTRSVHVGRCLNLSDLTCGVSNLTLRLSGLRGPRDVDAKAEAHVQGSNRGVFEAGGGS